MSSRNSSLSSPPGLRMATSATAVSSYPTVYMAVLQPDRRLPPDLEWYKASHEAHGDPPRHHSPLRRLRHAGDSRHRARRLEGARPFADRPDAGEAEPRRRRDAVPARAHAPRAG